MVTRNFLLRTAASGGMRGSSFFNVFRRQPFLRSVLISQKPLIGKNIYEIENAGFSVYRDLTSDFRICLEKFLVEAVFIPEAAEESAAVAGNFGRVKGEFLVFGHLRGDLFKFV
jgi:hypothetical protein